MRMEIYVADVENLRDSAVFQEKMCLVTAERREKILRYKSAEDRRRGLGAGLLLEYGLRRRGFSLLESIQEKKQVELAYTEHGKAYITECPDCFFNLSHAGTWAAAVFADVEAGIDVESIRTPGEALMRRVFSAAEQERLRSGERPDWMPERAKVPSPAAENMPGLGETLDSDVIFTGMWTRKESYGKAVGGGMHLPLADFDIMGGTVGGDPDFRLRTWELSGGMLSVCAKEQIEAEPVEVDLDLILER